MRGAAVLLSVLLFATTCHFAFSFIEGKLQSSKTLAYVFMMYIVFTTLNTVAS
jgi:hypothetical protein